ncbi:MAG: bifunctional UDP-N-acetylglucosamine diphosphorylase/glucosamine-1-phosphate N-acetyltransferase GlmU [Pseudomonadota bacterium]
MSLSIIILAAGKGTRMKSSQPKVLHKIANREMLNLVIDTAKEIKPDNISVVISSEMEKFAAQIAKQHPKTNLTFAIQKQQLGTANAVEAGMKSLKKVGDVVLVLYGDTPLIKAQTLKIMVADILKQQNAQGNTVCVLGFHCYEANKYGHLVIDKNQLIRIVEFKDATAQEKAITLCNSGVIAVNGAQIKNLLTKINNKNASGEFYLTDIVGVARKQGLSCGFIHTDENEVMGVNSRVELAKADKIKQKEIRNALMESGVTMHNPKSIYFSFDTKISNDVIIHPNVVFGTGVEIDSNVEIKSFSHIEGTKIKSGAVVGPFARLRPETVIEEDARIGNFVEIKKSIIKKGAKVNHLSYIGDAEIGQEANIGAGTITCNYDGYKKSKTKIGKKVFIGSNSALIAPVNIGDGAVIGAGSVIISDVKKDDLAISRSKQENIKNGGKNYHNKKNR